MKKLLSVILTVLLLFTSFSVPSLGDESVRTEIDTTAAAEGLNLGDGDYTVPLVFKTETSTSTENFREFYRTGYLSVKGGAAYLTVRFGNYVESNFFYVLKDEYYNEKSTDGIIYYDDTDMVDGTSGEYRNSNEVTIDNKDTVAGIADISFSIENPNQPILLYYYSPTMTVASVMMCEVIISPIYDNAQEIQDPNEGTEGVNWALEFNNTGKLNGGQYYSTDYAAALKSLIAEDNIEVTASDGIASVKVNLKDGSSKITEVKKMLSAPTAYSSFKVYNTSAKIYNNENYFEKISVVDDTVTIPLKVSPKAEIALGSVYAFKVTDENGKSTRYYSIVRLSSNVASSIVIEDKKTGIEFETTTANLPATAVLNVDTTADTTDAAYKSLSSIGNFGKNWLYYNISITNDGQEYSLTSAGELRIPVPDGWGDNVVLYKITDTSNHTGEVEGEIKTIDGKKYFVIQTSDLNKYALVEQYSDDDGGSAEDLADGTYSVPVHIYNVYTGGASMADAAIQDAAATLVVKGGRKDRLLKSFTDHC